MASFRMTLAALFYVDLDSSCTARSDVHSICCVTSLVELQSREMDGTRRKSHVATHSSFSQLPNFHLRFATFAK